MSARVYAERAYKRVCAHRDAPCGKDGAGARQFRTLAMNAPVLIRQAGPLQAIAFWRRTSEGKKFSDDVAHVLNGGDVKEAGARLMQQVAAASDQDYLRHTRDLVAVATWLRRFAQAELSRD